MRQEDRLSVFIRSMQPPLPPYLERIRQEAVEAHVPVIRLEMCSLLQTVLAVKRPASILEIGTAVGFSSLWMAACTDPHCRILTIEQNEARIRAARANFAENPCGEKISLIEGDAGRILETLTDSFDFIFLDAAKGQYQLYYPRLKELLREDGILLCDNVLQGGDILESRYALERRNRTIHKRMRGFLYDCMHDPQMTSCILPVADGAAMCVKTGPGPGLYGQPEALN